METKQVQQLKLNVTNISSFLKQSNKTYIGLKKKNSDLLSNQVKEQKLQEKEKKIETKNITGFGLGKIGNKIASTGGSIFDKILGFGSYILAGILVNSLPEIFKKVMEFVDNIVNFVTPIYSGFRLLQAIITKEPLDDPELSPEKKRFTDELKKAKLEVDKIQKNLGIGGFILTPIQLFINEVIRQFGGNSIVLATRGGKEGFLDTNTDTFFEKQFTSAERIKYETMRGQGMSGAASTSSGSSMGSQDRRPFYEGQSRSGSGYFNQIYNLAVKHGAKFPEVVAAQAMHETGFMDPNLPSVFNATGRTNPFGQTGDRGYGTIAREGDPSGWTVYPSLDVAVKDHIALWHRVSNHPQNYEAFNRAIDGIAAVAKVYSPDADPANIKLGYTADGYSRAMVKILKGRGFDPYKPKNKFQSAIEGKNLDGRKISTLNTTIGEEGSTTIIYARQQVIT